MPDNIEEKNPIIVIGLGNVLMGDEGIGVELVNCLQQEAALLPGVDFLDLGTGGMKVVHALAGRSKAVLLDCAFMQTPPGTLRRFTPEEVVSTKLLSAVSGHAADLLKLITLSRQLGECPETIVIFGIEPQQLQPGRGLSPLLKQQTAAYLAQIRKELIQDD